MDTATIIVHGVTHKGSGWSQTPDATGTSFQEKLTLPRGHPRIPDIDNPSLNHDFYEFNWGGFAVGTLGFIPIKSVHQMALVHLQMTEFVVWMNGYANIDIISHSWGTTLTYDLQNTSGIETRNWVTMGAPLKSTTDKPALNTGLCGSIFRGYYDGVVTRFEMYPAISLTSTGCLCHRFWPGPPSLPIQTWTGQLKYRF